MNITDAAYHTVHDYPGGSEALAPRMGMSAAVLRNKVNPHNTTHHLTLAEAHKLMVISGDHRLAHALAGDLGYTLQRSEGDTGSLITALLGAAAGQGDLAQLINEVLADNLVTPNEAAAVNRVCSIVQARLVEVASCATAAALARGLPA